MPYAHRLNFVIVDVAREVQYADEFFALLEFLYIFLTRQMVHEVFIKLHKAQKLIPRELGRLSIKERLVVIIDVLNEVQHFGDAEVSVQVKVDIVQQVQSCQFPAKLIVFAEFCQQPTVSVIDSEAHCNHKP